MEWNDIYDVKGNVTGKLHRRGTPWHTGEYGLVVCVWVYDGKGKILLTRRAPGKSFAGTWENSGGAAQAGETSRQAIARELFEETGIRVEEGNFEFIRRVQDKNTFYDHYCLQASVPLDRIRLQPGETDDVQWADFDRVHELIREKKICRIISKQFLQEESMLRKRQTEKTTD